MTAPAVTHEPEVVPSSATRWRAVCPCSWRSSTSNDKTKAREAGESHARSKRTSQERMDRRAAVRREQNRRTVNQVANDRNRGAGYSRTEWEALDRNTRKQLTEQAQAAVNRIDDGEGQPGDREIADVLDRHLQWGAFVPPELLCVHGNTSGCNPCFLDHDQAMRRAEDQ